MPSKHTAQAPTSQSPSLPFSGSGTDSLFYFTHLQANAWKAMLKWQVESLDFIKHRYQQDLKFIDEVLESPEPGEMLSAYSCFLQNALDEYSKESVKVANYSSKMVTDTAKELRRQAETISQDMMTATVA